MVQLLEKRNAEEEDSSEKNRVLHTRNGFHNTAWGRRRAAHPRSENGDRPEPHRGSTTSNASNAETETKDGIGSVEPRWGSNGFVPFFLGCAVVTATPGFVVKPRWG